MTGLRVTPTRLHGRDRLHVSLPDGRSVAWYDRQSGRVSLLYDAYEDDVRTALAPYVTGTVTVGPPPVPTPADLARLSLHPDDDLAPNRPGEALHLALDRAGRPAPRLFRRDPRPAELAAHQRVGDALDRLDGAGWRVLHSVPLPGAARIDHLAIGPGGVLVVRTVAARGHRVRFADPLVAVGRAEPLPRLRWLRRDAERAAHALATAVHPVLAVAEAARWDLPPGPPDVRVLRDGEIPSLAALGGVLKPVDIDALYATARDRRTWLAA
ncbi:nuclease-related domain-containing protein [Streptomyces sp. NPDC006368]|uniref:nuclease-related domain-containing protein n=1 Tax=Streptomyces sp. NPDC006368 TaxID=3156760 RepID=UPI0033BA3F68